MEISLENLYVDLGGSHLTVKIGTGKLCLFERAYCFADFAFFSYSQILNLLSDSTVKVFDQQNYSYTLE